MNLNPYQSAGAAALYIVVIVNVMQFVIGIGGESDGEDMIIIPIMMLSLFTLSVAVMGFLFGYGPLTLYLEGKKQEALSYIFRMVGTFAAITVVFVLVYAAIVSAV